MSFLVRSLYLDTSCYTDDVLRIFEKLGNTKVNAILEENLNDLTIKLKPTDNRDKRLDYITAKYQLKTFVSPTQSIRIHYDKSKQTIILEPEDAEKVGKWIAEKDLPSLLRMLITTVKVQTLQHSFMDVIKAMGKYLKEQNWEISAEIKKFWELSGAFQE